MSRLLTESEAEALALTLKIYEPNPFALKDFQASKFAVIAGPTGAGKDTIRNELTKRYPELYVPILSTTTRPPRVGEQDGIDYHFREIDEVESGVQARDFFQADLVHNQQISCLDITEIRKLKSGQTGLSILIVKTEADLRKLKSDIKTVFLIPPSIGELKRRMQASRGLSPEELERRVVAACQELTTALDSPDYYCLLNDSIDQTIEAVHNFLQTGQPNAIHDEKAREIIQQILNTLSIDNMEV